MGIGDWEMGIVLLGIGDWELGKDVGGLLQFPIPIPLFPAKHQSNGRAKGSSKMLEGYGTV